MHVACFTQVGDSSGQAMTTTMTTKSNVLRFRTNSDCSFAPEVLRVSIDLNDNERCHVSVLIAMSTVQFHPRLGNVSLTLRRESAVNGFFITKARTATDW